MCKTVTMQIWKLSIKPQHNAGFHPFDFCYEKGLIGIGWHHAFSEIKQPDSHDEAEMLVTQKWGGYPGQVRDFVKVLQVGHLVWIHQQGKYFLCRVSDNNLIYGHDIHENFSDLDLGHVRRAEWVEVDDDLVPGTVQRGVIARRTIQRIYLDDVESKYCEYLFTNIKSDSQWKPKIDSERISTGILNNPIEKILPIFSPDDLEDIVAFYLQNHDWKLIKSTCFRSKPKFEFSMIDSGGNFARVQVKSGTGEQLRPSDYGAYIKDGSKVFLFSRANEPYPGDQIERVISILHSDIYNWLKENNKCLSLPMKTKLMIWTESV